MEKLRKERTVARSLFTRAKNTLDENLQSQNNDRITAAFGLLQQKAENLFSVDERIKEQWLDVDDINEEQFLADTLTGESYRYDWEEMKVRYNNFHQKEGLQDSDFHQTCRSTCTTECHSKNRIRLPKIELRKFDGNVRNWIGFWGQFQKIDGDETMSMVHGDKFQYLFQCTVPDSPARELIDSFPPSGNNYRKAIDQLKARFAREELLIEIYVRELLNLVLAQAKCNTSHYNLGHLYDKLNTQLQALESLGVTTDKYAALLFPLVESALPESVLRAWERSQGQSEKPDDNLNKLLAFLKREVETEERIQLARGVLTSSDNSSVSLDDAHKKPTASCLVSTEESKNQNNSCIWCEKSTHSSLECYKANKMTYEARKKLLINKRGCHICLKTGHNNKRCKNLTKCLVCSKRHSVLMCPDIKMSCQENIKVASHKPQNTVSQSKGCTTLLQTLMVNIVNGDNNKCLITRAFIDTGAQKSYVRRDIIKQLGLKSVNKEILSHCLFGGIETKKEQCNVYEFCVKSLNDDQCSLIMNALDKETICGFIPRANSNEIMQQLKKHNITLSDAADVGDEVPEIGLLIGADYAGQLLTNSFIQLDKKLVAMKTTLGWTLQGPIINACSTVTTVVSANFQITEMWDLESLGIKDPAEVTTKAKADSIIIEYFKRTVRVNNEGRYEVNLPWKPGYTELLDNKNLAEKRLMSTTRRLLQLNEFEGYGQIFNDWLKMGIIEEVVDNQLSKHFLPHHPVIKNSSLTTRVRPVFDASARDINGNSLNAFLEKGVNCLELIPKLLIKFRKRAIGITSDIKKAFLQISLREEDRQYLSFLWWKNNKRKELITYRHCRVVFGLTSSPFLLGATIIHHLDKYTTEYKNTAERLKNSYYVDNCITSLDTEKEAKVFIEEAKKTMTDGKFELRGWVTAPVRNEEMTGEEEILSVLGLVWDLHNDELYCNINFINDLPNSVTKRKLLSITQKLFDPIGVVCPVTLVPKLIIQKTWKLKYSWDKELPDNLQKEFQDWLKYIGWLNECRIPRRITTKPIDECQNSIHVFSDASKVSFAAYIYLRSERDGDVTVQLLQAKSRVAPVHEVTIPRLELMAALIATRLYKETSEALALSKCKAYFWTDSSVTLTWITTYGDWNTFVKNRVKEIREHTNLDDWYHLPGKMNPADLPSRGCNAKTLQKIKWWEGPIWLKGHESEWPKSIKEIDEKEVNKEKRVVANNTTNITTFLSTLTYFSKYTKIIRMVGWIMRFIHNCKYKNNKFKEELSYEEYLTAEKNVLKMIQNDFMKENDIKMKDMHLFKDKEGIIRIRTKLLMSDEPADFVCPIYLPGKHPIIERLISDQHRLLNHAGSGTLIANLRERFWITGARKLVKSAVARCVCCKRQTAKCAETPITYLPGDRVKPSAVFQVTGIDLAGPLFLSAGGKVWIVIFTCAVYRAVHLEVTKSLSTDSFIMVLRRFIARRGRVETIYSDNGTNFHGANNELASLNWAEIVTYSNIRKINWKFNPPAAPWWGGWWERLVRSIKELLRRNLGKRTVSYDELQTILCDCEAIINARPLTYIADDTEKLKPLTPAHFLQGLPNSDVTDLDQIDKNSLNRRLRYLYKVREDIRNRFKSEYLGMLIQKGKEKDNNVRVGDVVLMETNAKRIKWPLAVVVEIYNGKDGHARVAKVKTNEGEFIRPFQRLYPLELSDAQSY